MAGTSLAKGNSLQQRRTGGQGKLPEKALGDYVAELRRLTPGMRTGGGQPGAAPPSLGRVRTILSDARGGLSPIELARLAAWTAAQESFRGTLLHHPVARSARRLRKIPPLAAVSLTRELIWYAGFLSAFGIELAIYESRRAALERAVVAGDWDEAWDVVCAIERHHGLSVHLLGWANAVLQRRDGIAAQKRLRDAVTSATRNSGVVNFVVAFQSIRNEPSVSHRRYAEIFFRRMDGMADAVPDEIADYLAWHLEPSHLPDPDAIGRILSFETSAPAIDMYETVLRAARFLCDGSVHGFAADTDVGQALRVLLELLVTSVGGTRERVLRAALALEHGEAAADCGAEEQALNVWLGAEVAAGLGPAEDAPPLARRLAVAAGLDEAAAVEREDLLKLAESFRTFHSADVLGGWLALVTTDSGPIDAWREAWRHMAAVGLRPAGRERLEQDGDVAALLRAESLAMAGGYDECARLLRPLCEHASEFICARAAALSIRTALAQGDRYGAVCTAAAAVVRLPRKVRERLPIESVIDGITAIERRELGSRCASLAVVYHAASEPDSSGYETECRQAAEECLASYGVERPSELGAALRERSEPLVTYLLREICLEDTLQKFAVFDSSREALEDRLAICRALHEGAPSDALQAEMTSLVRRLMLQRGLRTLAKSKVFVDIPRVTAAAGRKFRDLYHRYQALSAVEDPGQRAAVEEALRSAESTGRASEIRALRLPKNERMDLFTQIVLGVRDEFAHSPEHGLDGYLSIRIRHGTLANHLRAPLAQRGLLATKDERSNTYVGAAGWDHYLVGLPPDEAERARSLLREFTAWYDGWIGVIAREWLQVGTRSDGKGMFDFALGEPILTLLASQTTAKVTFEEFIEKVITVLVFMLDDRLKRIRERIANEAAPSAQRTMDELAGEVARLAGLTYQTPRLWELTNEIRVCRGEVATAFARLDEWFRRAPEIASEPFHLGDVLRVCAEVVRPEGGEPLTLSLSAEVDSGPHIDGDFFQPLADIFTIVLQNVMRHSGLPRRTASVEVACDESFMEVRVLSPVAEGRRASSEERLESIRATIASDESYAYVGREGGSGFLKIAKILTHELNVRRRLKFGFMDEAMFEVVLTFPIRVRSEAA